MTSLHQPHDTRRLSRLEPPTPPRGQDQLGREQGLDSVSTTGSAGLMPSEVAELRRSLEPDAIPQLCAMIDGAIDLDMRSQHDITALADRLDGADTRTAHYLILSGDDLVGCTIDEDGKADADRSNTFQKVQPGTICPHCEWLVEAQTFRPL